MVIFNLEQILEAYKMGLFPMAYSKDSSEYHWVRPEMRGVIFIDKFNIPKSLKKFMAHMSYKITKNKAFLDVIEGCCETTKNRLDSWINSEIIEMFVALNKAGYADSYECWNEEDKLIGGLYGLKMGKIFCGESMFSREENASKVCLVRLYEDLKQADYTLIDTQFVNEHLLQFGAEEIPHQIFLEKIKA